MQRENVEKFGITWEDGKVYSVVSIATRQKYLVDCRVEGGEVQLTAVRCLDTDKIFTEGLPVFSPDQVRDIALRTS